MKVSPFTNYFVVCRNDGAFLTARNTFSAFLDSASRFYTVEDAEEFCDKALGQYVAVVGVVEKLKS